MNGEQQTVIGAQTTIRGNLQGDENLVVRGRVEGNITLSKALIVESGGIVQADIDVRNAEVSGVVVGNITASEYVQINEDGRMVGDISAPRVIIVDGAAFRGHVDMGDVESARPPAEATRPAQPARTPPTQRPAARQAPARSTASRTPVSRRPTAGTEQKPAPPPKPKPPTTTGRKSPPKPPSVAKGKKKVRKKK